MAIRFEWDRAKARRNLRRHGVSFEEATTAFDDELSMTMPDPVHSIGEERFILLGQTNRGRLVVVVFTGRDADIPSVRLSLHASPTRASATTMKKVSRKSTSRRQPSVSEADDILPHYDFRGAVRGKYAARYRERTNVVVLDPDVAARFPNAAAVNRALRALAEVADTAKPKRSSRRRTA